MSEAAPAKINLYLHITGRRPDGLHVLDSLVVFAEIGDGVTVAPSADISLSRSGAMVAGLPPVEGDLVFRAAHRLAELTKTPGGAAIHVEKNLPVASGIGGGSADAAATIRSLLRLWSVDLTPDLQAALAEELGADISVCLRSRPSLMAGVGEQLSSPGALPPLYAILANPGVSVSTAEVFAAFAAAAVASPANPPASEPWSNDPSAFIDQLAARRNDLTSAALSLCPAIGDVLASLEAQPECRLARMSGSGATCFGLFATPALAQAAADRLQRDHPNWWVAATALNSDKG
ncbi:MAG: 4-(cytidine 5'-diphospho)-2-C-methyl-D-erythritol kinase [Alphaproteobacteria bacterium]|nr:4-(cytidine 5'-diphospho)-2-C-methyl-D-erythritol kinase [Alphaproteobacteria bacterium]